VSERSAAVQSKVGRHTGGAGVSRPASIATESGAKRANQEDW